MTFFNYLQNNLRWQFVQNPFGALVCPPTSKATLYGELDKLAEKYFPQNAKIDTLQTEFCLNKIALSAAKNRAMQLAKSVFVNRWTTFVRLDKLFRRPYMRFPSDGAKTRVERIAETIVKCSQNCLSDKQTDEISEEVYAKFDLTLREKQYFPEVLQLVQLRHYCALCATDNAVKLAKVLQPQLIAKPFAPNDKYVQAVYRRGKISAVVNCFGNSALSYGKKNLGVRQTVKIYASGRNVFDTFTESRYGQNTAEFRATTNSLTTQMQYFLTEFCQVRRFCLTNKCRAKRRYVIDVAVTGGCNEFFVGDSYTVTDNDVYITTAVVTDNKRIAADVNNGTITFTVEALPTETVQFDVVTVLSHNIDVLTREVNALDLFGQTRCDMPSDNPAVEYTVQSQPIKGLTGCSNQGRLPAVRQSQKTAYTYQLGDCDVGTFLDNDGKINTLINGFCFGGGEAVYSVANGRMTCLTSGKCTVDGQTAVYDNGQSTLTVSHDRGKHYDVTHKTPCKTLFYFPFESSGKVTRTPRGFSFVNADRRFDITFGGAIDSYTTDSLECNADRPRYKLSGNGTTGTCLAICFAKSTHVQLTITNRFTTPQSKPILHESLVSTYLNYINNKSVFCLTNRLVRPDPLTLAAICYTNPDFVRYYVTNLQLCRNSARYYDADGKMQTVQNKLLFALPIVYYANLVADDAFPGEQQINAAQEILLTEEFSGREICVKALALRKATKLTSFDRTKCAVEYAKVKKQICEDNTLYAYAQAIGAVDMTNPSKQRLRDLCGKLCIPKNWYYVSQIENLYGMNYSVGRLSFAPRVSADNVLEQISLSIDGHRISTTFKRSNVQSMTLNGVTHFQPFCPSSLKQTDNTLVVTY